MNKGRIYCAGPMTGYIDYNFPAFYAAATELRSRGWDVVNPADLNIGNQKDWKGCMIEDIKHLLKCDAIVMLPGWEKSKGASLEHHIATELGLMVYHYSKEGIDD